MYIFVNKKLNARRLTNKLVMAVAFGKRHGSRVKGAVTFTIHLYPFVPFEGCIICMYYLFIKFN